MSSLIRKMKDITRLIPKKIIDKIGRHTTVYVKPFPDQKTNADIMHNKFHEFLNLLRTKKFTDKSSFKEAIAPIETELLQSLGLSPIVFDAVDPITKKIDRVRLIHFTDFVNVNFHPTKPLMILKYSTPFFVNSIKYPDKVKWTEHIKNLRGTVIDYSTGEIVTLPFPKFFNISTTPEHIENEEAYISNLPQNEEIIACEKKDGILISLSMYKGKLLFTTSGAFRYNKNKEENKFLREAIEVFKQTKNRHNILKDLKNGWTFMFELISPLTHVVVDYGKERSLYLTGARNKYSGELKTDVNLLQYQMKTPNIKTFKNIKEAVEFAEKDKSNIEGYVLRFPSINRLVKLKTQYFFSKYQTQKKVNINTLYKLYKKDKLEEELSRKLNEEFLPILKKTVSFFNYFDKFIYKLSLLSVVRQKPEYLKIMDPDNYLKVYNILTRTYNKHHNNKQQLNHYFDKYTKKSKTEMIKTIFSKPGIGQDLKVFDDLKKIFVNYIRKNTK